VTDLKPTGETRPSASSPSPLTGLSRGAVSRRAARGLTNVQPDASSRSVWDIVRANVFTLFNGIVAASFALLLVLGQWQDALFGFSALGNAIIGVVQEYRAKRSLDRLAVLNAPRARVVRDGLVRDIPVEDVVMDDVLVLRAGDKVTADADVVESAGLEVDESLITGEADPVDKSRGSEVLSGSSVLSGQGEARVTRVGADSFASRLTLEARQFSLVNSEIRNAINRVLKWITWALLPIMLVVVNGQMQVLGGWETALRTGSWRSGSVGAVAAVIAMIPLGLVLVTSVAFAVGGVRLARQKVLVRELAAVEGLARVDVLCLDKTGTLTEGRITFDGVHPLGRAQAAGWKKALGWFGADPNANSTARCLTADYPDGGELDPIATVPFSSTRKWSAVQFPETGGAHGTWILGAPEFVLGDAASDTLTVAAGLAASGRRTLVLAYAPGPLAGGRPENIRLPPSVRPVVLVTFREGVRSDARQTLAYFHAQGVQIRVISGDDPRTVAAIARELGLGPVEGFDARELPEGSTELADVMETQTVFGRVTPAQKRLMVAALQSRGHVVAMTGDGVNDIPALKVADIGIAMNSAAAATKAVSRLVLLDDRFDRLPSVVAEGRRVIANIERISMLYLAKTVYAVVLSITFGALLWGFPFLPRQLSVTDGLTIGIPAFFLALVPNIRRYRSGFLARSLSFAVPAGIIVSAGVAGVHICAEIIGGYTLEGRQTSALIVLTLTALWILVVVSRPLATRGLLVIGFLSVVVGLMFTVPISTDFLGLQTPSPALLAATLTCALAGCLAIEILARVHAGHQTLEPSQ
jgi:cation-transporting ATPase E